MLECERWIRIRDRRIVGSYATQGRWGEEICGGSFEFDVDWEDRERGDCPSCLPPAYVSVRCRRCGHEAYRYDIWDCVDLVKRHHIRAYFDED